MINNQGLLHAATVNPAAALLSIAVCSMRNDMSEVSLGYGLPEFLTDLVILRSEFPQPDHVFVALANGEVFSSRDVAGLPKLVAYGGGAPVAPIACP